ncbi:integrase, partial [Leptospira stimsonii]
KTPYEVLKNKLHLKEKVKIVGRGR